MWREILSFDPQNYPSHMGIITGYHPVETALHLSLSPMERAKLGAKLGPVFFLKRDPTPDLRFSRTSFRSDAIIAVLSS